jgi:deoxyhypusine synthase
MFQKLFAVHRYFSITGHDMEGLGIAANVIAVVDLVVKTGGVIGDYIKSAKGCTETTKQLYDELKAVESSLERLNDISKSLDEAAQKRNLNSNQSSTISQLSESLRECPETINVLPTELGDHFGNKVRGKFRRKLRWPIKEPKVVALIQKIGRYRQIFQQALQSDLV